MATAVVATRAAKFWIFDPVELTRSINVVPSMAEGETSGDEFYNVLTRLLILGVVVMYAADWHREYIWHVLAGGIVLIFALYAMRPKRSEEGFSARLGMRDPCENCGLDSSNAAINSTYELTPFLQFNADNASKRSYMNAKYEVVPQYVPSPYSEPWRLDSSDITPYTNVPDSYTITEGSEQEELPQSQTNYITRSSIDNVGGIDHEGGLVSVRNSVESAFQRDSSFHRDTMMGEFIDQIASKRGFPAAGSGFVSGKQTF